MELILSDGSIKVCYEEDGFVHVRSSRPPFAQDKKQLKEMVRRMGKAAFEA